MFVASVGEVALRLFAARLGVSNGDIVKGDVVKDARGDPFVQTDLVLHHQIIVHEGQRLDIEANFSNLFNQRASTVYYEFMIPTNLVSPTRASRFPGPHRSPPSACSAPPACPVPLVCNASPA